MQLALVIQVKNLFYFPFLLFSHVPFFLYVEGNPHGPPFSFSNVPCPSSELLFPHPFAVMVLHAAFRKLTPAKQSARSR